MYLLSNVLKFSLLLLSSPRPPGSPATLPLETALRLHVLFHHLSKSSAYCIPTPPSSYALGRAPPQIVRVLRPYLSVLNTPYGPPPLPSSGGGERLNLARTRASSSYSAAPGSHAARSRCCAPAGLGPVPPLLVPAPSVATNPATRSVAEEERTEEEGSDDCRAHRRQTRRRSGGRWGGGGRSS
mmetsp:Transcript_36045/g.107793  ORF Transcript_36045/g.107793 Transcript_36045/m.107793 type:complete len:184 (-) Transcript_36045:206-757(-)